MSEINTIFPTSVGIYKLDKTINAAEMDFIVNQTTHTNTGNEFSLNTQILQSTELSTINHFIHDSLESYWKKVYDPSNNLQLKITQSWANYTRQGQFHHKHNHPNSVVSGIFYVQTLDDIDRIYFEKPYKDFLLIPSVTYTQFNSRIWWFRAETNALILFPSHLDHWVAPISNQRSDRISIAFNTFIEGEIGEESFYKSNFTLTVS